MNLRVTFGISRFTGMGSEAGGDQKDCPPSRLVPLASRLASQQFREEPS